MKKFLRRGDKGGDKPLINAESPDNSTPPPLPPKPSSFSKKTSGSLLSKRGSAKKTPSFKNRRQSIDLEDSEGSMNEDSPQASQKQTASNSPSSLDQSPQLNDSTTDSRLSLETSASSLSKRTWAKSPRGSSGTAATSSPLFSPRTKTSIPPVMDKSPRASAAAKKEKTQSVIQVDPVDHVLHYQQLLAERMRSLGNTPAPYEKAIAQLHTVLNDSSYSKLLPSPISALRALMPLLTQKPPAIEAQQSPHHDSLDSDTQSQPKISSSEPSDEKSHSQSISGSSPDDDAPMAAIPAAMPDEKQLPRSSDGDSHSPDKKNKNIGSSSDSSPRQDDLVGSSPEKDSLALKAPDQQNHIPQDQQKQEDIKEAMTSEQSAHADTPSLTLLPVCDLLTASEIENIIANNELSLQHPALASLNIIISKIENLRGQFAQHERFLSPLTTLRDYYQTLRQLIIDAKNSQEREIIFSSEASFVCNAFDGYFVLDKGKYASSTEKALALFCCDEHGVTHKTNEFGNRAGGAHNGMWIKKDPPAGPHLKPPVESAVGSWYQLFDQRDLNAAPSSMMKVLHAHITPTENPGSSTTTMTHYYNQNATVQRTLQCGFLVQDSVDFQLVIEACMLFINWQKGLNDHLESTLNELEALFQADKKNIESLDNWPQALIQHSGCKGAEIARIPRMYHVMRDIIGNFTPKKALQEIPTICEQLDHYHFSAFFIANLGIDPTDLSGGNVRFAWKTLADGSRMYRLVCIDADEALDFPVHSIDGTHQNSIKNIMLLMKRNTQKPIDPVFRAEFLSHSPLHWVLKWCQLIYPQDQSFRKLVAEKAVDKVDLYDDEKNPQFTQEFKDRHKAELLQLFQQSTTRRDVIPMEQSTALEITMSMHPERLPSMLQTIEKLQRAMEKNPQITPEECTRVARPATALHYESVGYPILNDDNFPKSLLLAYIATACKAPSFEEHFLNDVITPLVQERLGDKFKPQYMNALTKYQKLLQEQEEQLRIQKTDTAGKKTKPQKPNTQTDTAEEDLLPSLESLTKECPLPDYCGGTLFDLLSQHTHGKDDYHKQATLSVTEAIKLFIKHIDFSVYIPKKIPELLTIFDIIGTHFPFADIKKTLATDVLNQLAALVAEAALPGALQLLNKSFANFSALNQYGETPLHALLRAHQQHPSEKVIATLEACLSSVTCDPEMEDSEQRTPLMTFIESLDKENAEFAETIIALMRRNKINLNLRTSFVRHHKFASKEAGTALDFAIDRDNITAFIALIHQGAGDCVDIPAAFRFIQQHKGHSDFDQAVELLIIRHPELAYEMHLDAITAKKPDRDHPAHCLLEGAEHGKLYFLEQVWNTLFDKKGDVNKANSVAEGGRIVIPLPLEDDSDPLFYGKFYPEFPGLQRFAEILLSLLSCATTRSELWRANSPDGKSAIPFNLITAVKGESLRDVLLDPAKSQEFHAKLDMNHFTLLSTILMLLGQEDGHVDQFKVVRMPTPPGEKENEKNGEKMIVVPVDLERILVSAFLHNGKEKILLLKDCVMLFSQFRDKPMTPHAIASLICANGKRLPTKSLSPEETELFIRENANRLFDRLTGFMQLIEHQHLRLFPRDENSKTCTLTGAEMFEENQRKPFATKFGNLMDKVESAEERQAQKTLSFADKLKGQSGLRKALSKLQDRLGLNTEITIIGCPVEKRTPSVLHQRFIHTARILNLKAGVPMTGMMLLRFIRPDIYPLYNGVVSTHPTMNVCEQYKVLTEGLTEQKAKADIIPRTLSKQMDVLVCVSQPISTKFRSEGVCVTAREAAEYYTLTKEAATLKAIAVHEISSGDTTRLQSAKTEQEFESFVNSLIWKQGNRDNRPVLNTILSTQAENGFWFRHLRIMNCKELNWKDLSAILQQSPTLETLDLSGSTGLQSPLNVNNLFKLLSDYCPSLSKLIINETEITSVDIAGHQLPSLTHFEAKNCPLLKSCSFTNSGLEVLDISGSQNCEQLQFDYTADQALKRPLEEERPLKVFNITGCTKLKGEDITGVLDRSPFLTDLIHGGNQEFNARSFAYFAFHQGRFNRRIFESMIQNGKLNLYGLPFEDKHLKKFQEWLGASNAPELTEINFRGCCLLTRLAMFEFVVQQESLVTVVYGGPVRGIRTAGGIDTWDIGLKNPITTIQTLANGGIIAFSKRVPVNARNSGTVEYNVRLPDDKGKDHSQSTYIKEVRAKHTVKPRTLIPGCDLRGVADMSDGSLLLSLQEDASQPNSFSHLLLLDPITDHQQPLDIPEVGSLAGSLCSINPTTFALHSDRFYLIQKHDMGWRIQHTAEGPDSGSVPITNGKDLVAYATGSANHRRLCVMNIYTGELIVDQTVPDSTTKPVLFLDETRLVFFNGTFYSVLNLGTQDIQVLEKHKESEITDPSLAWAYLLPTGELFLSGGPHTETFDPVTLRRITHDEAVEIPQYLVSHNGDEFFIQEKQIKHDPKRFFVIDLSFRQQPQRGYECLRVERGHNAMQILTPEAVLPSANDIDESGGNVPWAIQMFSGKPTSTTLYDMLYAFFEHYDKWNKSHEHFVTHKDMSIIITGLSDQECAKLPTLLNLLWKKTPSIALQEYRASFYAQNRQHSVPRLSSRISIVEEESPEQVDPYTTTLN